MNWWREHYECWARQQSIARVEQEVRLELPAAPQAMNDAYERCRREIDEALYGGIQQAEPQQFQLLTIAGQASYSCPPEVTRIGELWIEDAYRYLLYQISPADLVQANLGVQARPIYFSFYDQHLHFYPIPDREYRVGFVQREEQIGAQLRIRLPHDFVVHDTVRFTNKAYYAARDKSLALLKEWLSPDQLKDFEQTSSFEVTGSWSKKRYRIHQSTAFNVAPLGERHRFCFVPENAESVGDIMLAQKIMLENDETQALKVANLQHS